MTQPAHCAPSPLRKLYSTKSTDGNTRLAGGGERLHRSIPTAPMSEREWAGGPAGSGWVFNLAVVRPRKLPASAVAQLQIGPINLLAIGAYVEKLRIPCCFPDRLFLKRRSRPLRRRYRQRRRQLSRSVAGKSAVHLRRLCRNQGSRVHVRLQRRGNDDRVFELRRRASGGSGVRSMEKGWGQNL